MMSRKTGRGPKAKGRAYENEVRQAILEGLSGLITEHDITARAMGDPGPDLILSAWGRTIIPFCPELKRTEKLEYKRSIEQARANSEKDGLPYCIITRQNYSESHVILRLEDFIKLLSERADVQMGDEGEE